MRSGIRLWPAFRNNRVFWYYFINSFTLIVIPVIVGAMISYFYSVEKIEDEVEKSNVILMNSFTRNVDTFLNSLQGSVFETLGSQSVQMLLDDMRGFQGQEYRIGTVERRLLLETAIKQLKDMMMNRDLIRGAYLYFPENQYVISPDGHYKADVFFQHENVFQNMDPATFKSLFGSRRSMHFVNAVIERREYLTHQVSLRYPSVTVVTSYPYISSPKVFLVLNLDQNMLRKLIDVPYNDGRDTLIMDRNGTVITHSGQMRIEPEAIFRQIDSQQQGAAEVKLDGKLRKLTYVTSSFNQWKFVSIVDLELLRHPATVIKNISLLFLVLFSSAGIVVSYYISRRMYRPIGVIKSNIEQLGAFRMNTGQPKNELDYIRLWSIDMITDHMEKSKQITRFQPLVLENWLIQRLRGQDEVGWLPEPDLAELGVQPDQRKLVLSIEYLWRNSTRDWPENRKALMLEEAKGRIKQLLASVWTAEPKNGLLVCIVGIDENAGKLTAGSIAERMKETLAVYSPYLTAAIAAGPTIDQIGGLREAYVQSLELLEERPFSSGIEVLLERRHDALDSAESFLTVDEVNRISYWVSATEKDELLDYVLSRLDDCQKRRIPARAMKQISHDLLNTIARTAYARYEDFTIDKYADLKTGIDESLDEAELKQIFVRACELLFAPEEMAGAKSRMFEEVTDYIQKHYQDALSLEFFADRYGMSLGHFSRSFKENVGDKYVDYVNKVKIGKAKEMLLETDERIEDISEKVGYLSYKSFNAIFKKYEGITPSKFRTVYRMK